jgi:hypothetical protein
MKRQVLICGRSEEWESSLISSEEQHELMELSTAKDGRN